MTDQIKVPPAADLREKLGIPVEMTFERFREATAGAQENPLAVTSEQGAVIAAWWPHGTSSYELDGLNVLRTAYGDFVMVPDPDGTYRGEEEGGIVQIPGQAD